MKIVFLDASTIGAEIDLSGFGKFGEFITYDKTSPEQTLSRVIDADIVLTNKVVLGADIQKQCKNLKLICITATGMNNIDLVSAKELGIEVKNVAGYSTNSVAQITFALVLSLLTSLNQYDKYTKDDKWSYSDIFVNLDHPISEIAGKKWGIIGLGEIGRKVASIAKCFDADVCYYSTSGKNSNSKFTQVSLEDMLKNCDIVSIHAPLNENTKNLIDAQQLALMKQDALLINVGRGGIVNEAALRDALEAKKIYAGIDVLEIEPMAKNSPLRNLEAKDRFIMTPHIAWASVEARTKLISMVQANIKNFLGAQNG